MDNLVNIDSKLLLMNKFMGNNNTQITCKQLINHQV
jgi:hypothetical protein